MDSSDKWYYPAYDERWRMLAVFRESDTAPKEEFVPHQAGLDGMGGSSYIDLVVCRYKDANTAWTAASDGTLEETVYFCQNQHADVVAIVTSGGTLLEQVRYSPYGIPFGLPGGDTNSDGDCDAADVTQIQSWIDAPAYSVLGDIDLDGDVDATDKSTVQASYQGATSGWGILGCKGIRSAFGGLETDMGQGGTYHARHRVVQVFLGRWLTRDPAVSPAGAPLFYEAFDSRPQSALDPLGLYGVGAIVSEDGTKREILTQLTDAQALGLRWQLVVIGGIVEPTLKESILIACMESCETCLMSWWKFMVKVIHAPECAICAACTAGAVAYTCVAIGEAIVCSFDKPK